LGRMTGQTSTDGRNDQALRPDLLKAKDDLDFADGSRAEDLMSCSIMT
jgi:hypothetical protein